MDIDINPEVLKNACKEAFEDLKVFTDDMDLPAFLAAAETYVNKSTDLTSDVAILRIWMLSKREAFNKHHSRITIKDYWRKFAEKTGSAMISGSLDKIIAEAGYSLKEKAE